MFGAFRTVYTIARIVTLRFDGLERVKIFVSQDFDYRRSRIHRKQSR